MKPDLPVNYLDDRREQAHLTILITEAIPVGTYYHNICLALTEVLKSMMYNMVRGKLRYYKKREYVENKSDGEG